MAGYGRHWWEFDYYRSIIILRAQDCIEDALQIVDNIQN